MDFGELIKTFGLAVAVLAVLGFAIWRVAVWLGANVLTPLIQAHIGFVKKVEASMDLQTQVLQGLAEGLEEVRQKIQERQ